MDFVIIFSIYETISTKSLKKATETAEFFARYDRFHLRGLLDAT